MDVVKTKLQTSTGYSGPMHAARALYSEQGFKGFFIGLTPTFVGYVVQGACKFGLNEY